MPSNLLIDLIDEELGRLYAVRTILLSLEQPVSRLQKEVQKVEEQVAASPKPTLVRLPPRLAPVRRERKRTEESVPTALRASIPHGSVVVVAPLLSRTEEPAPFLTRTEPASSFGAMVRAAERAEQRA